MLQVIYCCLEFWTQNHLNSKSGKCFWTQDNKTRSRTDTEVRGKKNPNKTDSLNDNWNERYVFKMEKCSLWDYLAYWETQFFFHFQVLWRGLGGKKHPYSNRWEQKILLSFYLLSCLVVFSLQPHKHWSFHTDFPHYFTGRRLSLKEVEQYPRSPRRLVRGRNQELNRVCNTCLYHIKYSSQISLPVPVQIFHSC